MKKYFKILIILVAQFGILKCSFSQVPSVVGIVTEAFALNPQSGSYNYFGVRVTLNQTYDTDVTVTGFIYDDGNGVNFNHPFSVTVSAGYLSNETSATFYQADPTATAMVFQNKVSPLYVTKSGVKYSTDYTISDFFGILHSDSLQNSDSTVSEAYLMRKNQLIINRLKTNYPNDISVDSLETNDINVTWIGILEAMAIQNDYEYSSEIPQQFAKISSGFPLLRIITSYNRYIEKGTFSFSFDEEEVSVSEPIVIYPSDKIGVDNTYYEFTSNQAAPNFRARMSPFMECAATVFFGAFGIYELYDGYLDLVKHGAEFKTVARWIGNFAKRYIGWLGVAFALYEMGNCTGWW